MESEGCEKNKRRYCCTDTFNRQAIRINPADITRRLLDGLDETTDNPMSLVQGGVMVRAGRKATLAEKLKVGDKRLEKYLLTLSSDGTSAGTIKTDIKTEQEGNSTHYTFSLTPDTTDTFLSELGIAFLLDKKIDRVQWIGQGMMPTYLLLLQIKWEQSVATSISIE